MTAPQTSKAWTITPNNRRVYTSLVDQVGFWAYTNKTALLATTNWTLKWSSDGTTGPADSSDNTDRIASAADFATRSTVSAGAQSWYVVENGEGVQLLVNFLGASDSIAQVSYSAADGFTLAGTTTHKPSATDEIILSGAKSVVGTSTTEDRVVQVWCADDGTGWRSVVFGSNAIRSAITLDKTTRVAPASTFPVPYVGGNFERLDRQVNQSDYMGEGPFQFGGQALQTIGTVNSRGFFGSVFTAATTRACRMIAQLFLTTHHSTLSTPSYNTMQAGGWASTYCASLGGSGALVWPLLIIGEKTTNLDGPWCTLIDWYQIITTSPTNPPIADMMPGFEVGDVPGVSGGETGVGDARTNWWAVLGAGALWPWRNAAAAMEIA